MAANSTARTLLVAVVALATVLGFVLGPVHAATTPGDDSDVNVDGDGGGNVSVNAGDTGVSADADAGTDGDVDADVSLSSGGTSVECSTDDADCTTGGSGPEGPGGAPGVDAPDASPERPDVDLSPDAPSATPPEVDRSDLPLGSLPADVFDGSVGSDDGPGADYNVYRTKVGGDEVWVVADVSAHASDDGPRAYGLGGVRAGQAGVGHFGLTSASAGGERLEVQSGSWSVPDNRTGDGRLAVERSGDQVTLSVECDGERCKPRKDGVPGPGAPGVEYGGETAPCSPWESAYEQWPDGPPGPSDPVFEQVPDTFVSPWAPPSPPLGYCSVYNPNDPAFNATQPPQPGEQDVRHNEFRRNVSEDGNVVWLVDTYTVDSGEEWPYAYGVSALRVTEDGRFGYYEQVTFTDTRKDYGAESSSWMNPEQRAGEVTVTATVVGRSGGADLDCEGGSCTLDFPGFPDDLDQQVGGDGNSSFPCSPWRSAYEQWPDGPPEGTEPVFEQVPDTFVSPWAPPSPPLGYCSVYNPNDPAFNATQPPQPGDQSVDYHNYERSVGEDGNVAWMVDSYKADAGGDWPYAYGVSALRVTEGGQFGYFERVRFSDTEKNTGVDSASWVEPDREAGRMSATLTVVGRSGGADLDCDGETCRLDFPGLPDDLDQEIEYGNESSDGGGSDVGVSGVESSPDTDFGGSGGTDGSVSDVSLRRAVAFPGFPSAFDAGLPGAGEAADALWTAVEESES